MHFWAGLSLEEKSQVTLAAKTKAIQRFDLRRAGKAFWQFYQGL
jgi:hypothetical protein